MTPCQDIFAPAATRRIDVVGIGDSNQCYSGFGWDHGFQYALCQRFPMYATGLIAQNENNGSGSGLGYGYNRAGKVGDTTGAPAQLEALWGNPSVQNYTYLSTGTFPNTWQNGLFLGTGGPANGVDVNAALRFWFQYGTFPTGTGYFQPKIRRETSPYTILATDDVHPTVDTGYGLLVDYFDLAAATRDYPLAFKWTAPGGPNINSPFFATWMRCEFTARTTGFSYHTLIYQGGKCLRDFLVTLNSLSDPQLAQYLAEYRRLQGDEKYVVFVVNSGVNDRNQTANSLGPNPAPSNTPAGYIDNLVGLMARIEDCWGEQGWSTDEIRWLIMPSHVIAEPDDANLIAYRAAASSFAVGKDRVQAKDFNSLMTHLEATNGGWYAASPVHLTQTGYEQAASRIVN